MACIEEKQSDLHDALMLAMATAILQMRTAWATLDGLKERNANETK